MEDQNNLKEKRVLAYSYIKLLFKSVNWADADLTKDEDLAATLKVNLSDLTLLREGKVNPSPKLVRSVKFFFKGDPDINLAVRIDHNLVEPF